MIRVPFSGTNVSGREITYPGGWDQNAKITLDGNGDLLIPWTSTNKEILKNTAIGGTTDYRAAVTGTTSNIDAGNTGAYLRIDWATDNDYEFTVYSNTDTAPCKVCKVEQEPLAEGTVYEYVSTGGLTPSPGSSLGGETMTRTNTGAAGIVPLVDTLTSCNYRRKISVPMQLTGLDLSLPLHLAVLEMLTVRMDTVQ